MATTFQVSDILADVATLTVSPAFTASTRVTTAQATYWLTQSLRSLSALLQQYFPDSRDLITVQSLTVWADAMQGALSFDPCQVHAVLWEKSIGEHVLLGAATQDDLANRSSVDWTTQQPRWRLEGDAIAVYPPPKSSQVLIVYQTTTTPLGPSAFVSRIDADRWLTLDVAIAVHTSKGQLAQAAAKQQQKALLENDFLNRARERQDHEPDTIRDVRGARALAAYRSRWQ